MVLVNNNVYKGLKLVNVGLVFYSFFDCSYN